MKRCDDGVCVAISNCIDLIKTKFASLDKYIGARWSGGGEPDNNVSCSLRSILTPAPELGSRAEVHQPRPPHMRYWHWNNCFQSLPSSICTQRRNTRRMDASRLEDGNNFNTEIWFSNWPDRTKNHTAANCSELNWRLSVACVSEQIDYNPRLAPGTPSTRKYKLFNF